MKELSGDQNGEKASSVPANACVESESRFRTHNVLCPSAVAIKAMLVPSGETVKLCISTSVYGVVPPGRATENCTGRLSAGVRLKYAQPMASPVKNSIAAVAIQTRRVRILRRFAAANDSSDCRLGAAICEDNTFEDEEVESASMANAKSFADWNRCCGLFSRQ